MVLAFQGLSLAEMAQEDALIEEGGAGGLEREAYQETAPEVTMDPRMQQKIEQATMEAYQEACNFGPGGMRAPIGGARAEVTGLRVAGSRTELAQAVEPLLRGLQALLLDIHAGKELGGAGSLIEVIAWAVVTRLLGFGV